MTSDRSDDPRPVSRLEALFLLVCGLAAALMLLGVPALEPAWVRARFWAFDQLRDFPLPMRAVLAVVCAAICIPAVNRAVWRLAGSSASAVRQVRVSPRLAGVLVLVLAALVFWGLRQRNFALGDSAYLIRTMTFLSHTQGYFVSFDEPIELLLHSGIYALLHPGLDYSVADAYALVSTLCGVGFLCIAAAWSKRVVADPGLVGMSDPALRVDCPNRRALAAGLLCALGSVQLFFGYVENYTVVATGALLYMLLAHAHLEGRMPLRWPALVLGVSFCLHVLAGWLFPSLLYLWWAGSSASAPSPQASPAGRRGSRARSLVEATLAVVLPVAATIALCAAIGFPPRAIKSTHLWDMKFLFTIDPASPRYRYGLFSIEHFANVLNQLLLTALPALLALCFVAAFHRRAVDARAPYLRFLLIAAVFLQVFASTWNPELGAYGDWDLFAIAGFGWGLLSVWLLVRHVPAESARYAGLGFFVIGLTFTGTFVVSNASRTAPVVEMHDRSHLELGERAVQAGDTDGALEHFLEAARANPANAQAQLRLGAAWLRKQDPVRARAHLEAYLRLAPGGEHAAKVRETLQGLP